MIELDWSEKSQQCITVI